ncbi:hypothetical protein [Citrobacter freundii]|uniref:hypothetical protein n=1 Tax=Citrobacter freundii TaxID=546 RepID=UPI0016471FD5|nr:hypothetical protein [Citrobacter freundii]
MRNQAPVLNIGLHVNPEFSGRILLYVENGVVKGDTPLMADEIIGTPTLFNQLLERAGYRLTPAQKG